MVEGGSYETFGAQEENLSRSLHFSTTIVKVLFESVESFFVQIASSRFEKLLTLRLLELGKLEPGTEIASCEVFLAKLGKFIDPLSALCKFLILSKPDGEILILKTLGSGLEDILLQCMLMSKNINLVEPFFDHSRHAILLHVSFDLNKLLARVKVVSSYLVPALEDLLHDLSLEVLSTDAANLTRLLDVHRALEQKTERMFQKGFSTKLRHDLDFKILATPVAEGSGHKLIHSALLIELLNILLSPLFIEVVADGFQSPMFKETVSPLLVDLSEGDVEFETFECLPFERLLTQSNATLLQK